MSNVIYINLQARLLANSKKQRKNHPTLGCPCRLWTGNTNNSGYPRYSERDENGNVVKKYAHRAALAIELAKKGKTIPKGFDVDHLCVTPGCIEPRHLEAVTPLVNQQRKAQRAAVQRVAPQRRRAA